MRGGWQSAGAAVNRVRIASFEHARNSSSSSGAAGTADVRCRMRWLRESTKCVYRTAHCSIPALALRGRSDLSLHREVQSPVFRFCGAALSPCFNSCATGGLDVAGFLKAIGNGCDVHPCFTCICLMRSITALVRLQKFAPQFTSWEMLMTLRSIKMKGLKIPTEQRKHIRSWVEKYKQGWTPNLPAKRVTPKSSPPGNPVPGA